MALSDPTRVVVEAEVAAGTTISYGDTVKLVPEYSPTSGSPAVDDLTLYTFKWTAYLTTTSPAQEDLYRPAYGIVDASPYPTMAGDGTGRTTAGIAGDKISVVVAGACLANVNHTGVNLTKDCLLYVGDTSIAGGTGTLVTDVARTIGSDQLDGDAHDVLTNDAHYLIFVDRVRAKSLVTTAVSADAHVVAPVLIFNNPFIAG